MKHAEVSDHGKQFEARQLLPKPKRITAQFNYGGKGIPHLIPANSSANEAIQLKFKHQTSHEECRLQNCIIHEFHEIHEITKAATG